MWAEGGRRPDGFAPPEGSETAPVPLARAVSALHIECADASPAVIAAWPPPFTAADAAAGRRASADTVSQGVVVSRQTGAATELTVRIKLQVVGEKSKMFSMVPELAALLGLTPGQMVSGEEASAPAAPPPPPLPALPRPSPPLTPPPPPFPLSVRDRAVGRDQARAPTERSGTECNQPTVSVRWKELNRLLGYEEHCRPDEPVKLPLLLDPNKARRRPRALVPLRLRRPPRPRRHAPSV